MFDLPNLIKTAGYLGVFLIIFAESGFFIGFFLPGDSLLFTAGFLASQGFFDISLLAGLSVIAAILGDSFGYLFGRRVGEKIFTREDSLLFHRDHLRTSHAFYQKHGAKTIVIARFMPIVRTFAPILAGVGRMNYRTFLTYNIIGGALWAAGLSFLGFYLGNTIPDIDRYLLPIIGGIIFLSILPTLIHVARSPAERRHIGQFVLKILIKIGLK